MLKLSKKNSINKIISFFFFLSLEIIILVLSIGLIFNLDFKLIFNENNIPETIKQSYLVILYLLIISNLYLLDKDKFFSIFKSKLKLIHFAKGFIIAFLLLSFLYIIEVVTNLISLKTLYSTIDLPFKVFTLSFIVAFLEEILFRNFIFGNLKQDFDFKKASLISSYIYAQLHFLNFNTSLDKFIMVLTGLIFVGLILNKTFDRYSIWFSIGIHCAWIFLISYTTQVNSFYINEKHLFLTGGYYPIAGLLGIVFSIFFLKAITKVSKLI